MRHFIIVKWNDPEKMKPCAEEIETLFKRTLEIPGIHSAEVYPSCSDRANRYDLMIEIGMDQDALAAWDASAPHKKWKEVYGGMLAAKTIFDCEE